MKAEPSGQGEKLDKSSAVPLYSQLKELIREQVIGGGLQPGSAVPPVRELCEVYEVSKITALRAISDLVNEGLLYRKQGSGTFVSEPALDISRTNVLGVGIQDPQYLFIPSYSCVIAGMAELASEHGYQIQIITTNSQNGDSDSSLYSTMLAQKKVDGLAVKDYTVSDADIIDIHAHGVPVVLFDRVVPGQDFCSVLQDNRGGAFQLVEHLVGLGHRRIGFSTSVYDYPPMRERYEGYRTALEAHGIEFHPEWLVRHGNDPQIVVDEVKRVLELRERPTAIVSLEDYAAIKVIKALYKFGCRVPEDISVTGFENIPQAAFSVPSLTVVDTGLADLGREMARMLLMLISGQELTRRCYTRRAELIVRESTAEPAC